MLEKNFFLSVCAMLLLPPVIGMAAPSTVLDDARITADMAKAEAKVIAERTRSKVQAEAALRLVEADLAKLKVDKTSKEAVVAEAQVIVQQAESAVQMAENDEAAAKAEVTAAKIVLERVTIVAEREENDAAVAVAEAAEDRVAAMEEQLEMAVEAKEEAREKANDARVAVGDAETELKDLENDLVLFRVELAQAKVVMIEAKKEPDLTKRRWATAEVESSYYTWRDNRGHSGYQLYQPYAFNYVNQKMEYSLRTGYVISENKSAGDGRVATWTDTVLGVAYSHQRDKDMIVYHLDINIPTGKGALNGADAIMSDDLVGLSRFGEGWNYTPGISVSRKIGEEDTWTLGTSYSFCGQYTYDGSVVGGWIEPGNIWVKNLRWQHIGQKWQLVGELSHTSAGVTQEGNITYRQGDQFDAKLTYNRGLSKDKNLMMYYWYTKEQPYTSADSLVAAGNINTTQHIGVMWSKNWAEKRTFRIGADMMKRDGNSYDPLTTLTSNGRTKYTWGVGYDVDIAADRRVSVDIKQFYINDDAPSNNQYHGCNVYFRYSYNM